MTEILAGVAVVLSLTASAAVLVLAGDGEGDDLLFGEVGKAFHGISQGDPLI